MIKLLLQHRQQGLDVDCQDIQGLTALAHAAERNAADVVSALLDARADHQLADCCDNTPIILCAKEGHLDSIRALAPFVKDAEDWQVKGDFGLTAEEWARRMKHSEVEAFIRARIDVMSSSRISMDESEADGNGDTTDPTQPESVCTLKSDGDTRASKNADDPRKGDAKTEKYYSDGDGKEFNKNSSEFGSPVGVGNDKNLSAVEQFLRLGGKLNEIAEIITLNRPAVHQENIFNDNVFDLVIAFVFKKFLLCRKSLDRDVEPTCLQNKKSCTKKISADERGDEKDSDG
uniref:ANK_REP_REGION domain-containing protein n=1 Tax=Macrostomum lignano TaxID=282301 RepID=A0A1I8GBE0_9PLAT